MNTMTLTEHQNVVANKVLFEIYQALCGKRNPFVSLSGPAGVGKTVCTQMIINVLKDKYNITATAPTHKATKVLSKNLFGVTSSTIHSFLSLKLKPDFNTGLQILIEDWSQEKSKGSNSVDILVVDEASQISFEMFNHIKKGVEKGKAKVVLFVGDSMQLKPVDNQNESIYSFIKSQFLTEIVRQAQDNPIIRVATEIRLMIESKNFKKLDELFTESFDTVQVYTDGKQFLNDYCNDQKDKIICTYTNEVVDTYNTYARAMIKGADCPYLTEGDELIFQETLASNNGKKIDYMNNDVVCVKSAEKAYDSKLKLWYWFVVPYDNSPFKVVDSDSLSIWKEYLSGLANSAKNGGKDTKRLWAFYFNEISRFANVKYTYASSLHKLQGSTYENVYFDFRSLYKYTYDIDTIYRLIYVALTRASCSVKVLK